LDIAVDGGRLALSGAWIVHRVVGDDMLQPAGRAVAVSFGEEAEDASSSAVLAMAVTVLPTRNMLREAWASHSKQVEGHAESGPTTST
jgi:hypothetical protein